ncbi:MAG: PucR family transcriptional regulator [Aeromicrobium sp.]
MTRRASGTVSAEGPAVVDALVADVDGLATTLAHRIRLDDYSYAETTLITFDELVTACRDNLAGILGTLGRDGVEPDRSAAVAAGRLKAERDIPLPAVLHAYRMAGRLIWEEVVTRSDPSDADALPGIAARMWAVIDEMSSVATDSYTEATLDRARADAQTRQTMLRALLRGEIHERSHLDQHLRVLRLAEHGRYLVACVDGPQPEAAPGASLEQALARRGLPSQWIGELRLHAGLIAIPDGMDVARAIAALQSVVSSRAGVSVLFEALESAPLAFREAQLAMQSAPPTEATVSVYGERSTGLLLARAPEGERDLARAVLGPLLQLPDADSLLETLALWFECEGSASAVAERQHFHRNTIHQRLRRIEQVTGRAVSNPVAAAELYLALQAVQLGHV